MIFDIVGTNISITAEGLTVPEFKKIWQRDKSKDKGRAVKDLSFVVFMADTSKKNPYRNYSESDRKDLLIKDFDTNSGDILIDEAIEKYKTLNTTRYKRLVTAALESSDEMIKYYKGVKFGSPDFDLKEYQTSISTLTKSLKDLRELEKQLDLDVEEESKVRGQGEIGMYEIARK
jgi:hypothetical protein